MDGLLETGWEPDATELIEHQVLAKMEYQAIRALMDAEDTRIAMAFEAKELYETCHTSHLTGEEIHLQSAEQYLSLHTH